MHMNVFFLFAPLLSLIFLLAPCRRLAAGDSVDPYLALENLDAPEALAWVERENERTIARLRTDGRFREFDEYILGEMNSQDRLVVPSLYRDTDVVFNFWRDADNPQGIVRESTLGKFFAGNPEWRTVLDLDALSGAEGKTWVFGGTRRLWDDYRKGMIALSDGGKDASEYREFDFGAGDFVEGGFFLPESKSRVTWFDADTLLVSSALTEDDRTESGYPRTVRIWKRGTPVSEAAVLYSCEKSDLSAGAGRYATGGDEPLFVVTRSVDFYNSEYFLYRNGGLDRVHIPSDSQLLGFHRGLAFVWLKSDWNIGEQTFRQDALVHFPMAQLTLDDGAKDVRVFYEPVPGTAFQDAVLTDGYVYLSYLEDVRSRIEQLRLDEATGEWSRRELPLNDMETAGLVSAPREKGFVLLIQEGFTSPTTLYRLDEDSFEKTRLQAFPSRFDPDAYAVRQEFAASADGARVPYFVVHRKGLELNGDNPVLQYGYGGFMVSLLPDYLPIQERCWLRDGGVYVLANIRGGGEYGPSWHEAALKRLRPRAFEDFIAVSEDLLRKGYTRPERLGIEGGSNGGLLAGAAMIRRPDLYGAVVIEVPLLDMLRFHELPPGASWLGEYGNPDDPGDREILRSYSPYQNLRKGVEYPPPLIVTSTKDDRVHPGHARKFARRLEEFGRDFYYYEELDGGHSGRANNALTAKREAMKWVYLHQRLMDAGEKNGEQGQ